MTSFVILLSGSLTVRWATSRGIQDPRLAKRPVLGRERAAPNHCASWLQRPCHDVAVGYVGGSLYSWLFFPVLFGCRSASHQLLFTQQRQKLVASGGS